MHGPVPVDIEGKPKFGVRKWPLKHEVKVVSVAIGDDVISPGSSTAEFDGGDSPAEGFSGHEFKV